MYQQTTKIYPFFKGGQERKIVRTGLLNYTYGPSELYVRAFWICMLNAGHSPLDIHPHRHSPSDIHPQTVYQVCQTVFRHTRCVCVTDETVRAWVVGIALELHCQAYNIGLGWHTAPTSVRFFFLFSSKVKIWVNSCSMTLKHLPSKRNCFMIMSKWNNLPLC
jgi:hypothetical protein